MLRVDHISKKFAEKAVLDDVSFSVAEASVVGVVGGNGQGKTTLFRLISGIYELNSGNVTCPSKVVYLPEERGLDMEETPCFFLTYIGRLHGMTKNSAQKRALALLDDFGLSDYADYRIGNLSKGMQQKVQFLSVLVSDASLFLLDEPFSGIDETNKELLKSEITKIREKGASVMVSSHDMDALEDICDDFLFLENGKIVSDGELHGLMQRYLHRNVLVLETAKDLRPSAQTEVVMTCRYPDKVETWLKVSDDASETNKLLSDILSENDLMSFSVRRISLGDCVKISKNR